MMVEMREESARPLWIDVGRNFSLVQKILDEEGVNLRKLSRDLLELLKLLGGHPLFLRVVLTKQRRLSVDEVRGIR